MDCMQSPPESWVLKILKYTFRIRNKTRTKHCSNTLALTAMAFKPFSSITRMESQKPIQEFRSEASYHLYAIPARGEWWGRQRGQG